MTTGVDDEVTAAGTTYTIEQLARRVGMSPRNVRAHQARRLLAPPARRGRVACYDESHVRRLERIQALQRQGFNLVSIEAILGVGPANDSLGALLQRLAHEQPSLVDALSRHGVLRSGQDGAVHVVNPHAVRSALDLHRARAGTEASLHLLNEVIDSIRPLAMSLVGAIGERVSTLAPGMSPRDEPADSVDGEGIAFSRALVTMLTEAFRVAVQHCAQAHAEPSRSHGFARPAHGPTQGPLFAPVPRGV